MRPIKIFESVVFADQFTTTTRVFFIGLNKRIRNYFDFN